MYLGCAVAAAPTGETFDTSKETVRKATSRMLTPGLIQARKLASVPPPMSDTTEAVRAPLAVTGLPPLARLGVGDD